MFSIIVPTHNRASLLQECLNSIKSQNFNEYEVWIMDDCSTDNTYEVVQPFLQDLRFHYYKFKKNNGAFQKVLSYVIKNNLCKYDYYILMSDDDSMPNNLSLSSAYNIIKKNSKVEIILSEEFYKNGSIKLYNPNSTSLPNIFYYDDMNAPLISKIQFAVHRKLEELMIYDTIHENSVSETSLEGLCYNRWVGYDKNIEYCFSLRGDNRKKYEKIYPYVLSVLECIYKGLEHIKEYNQKIIFFKKTSNQYFDFKLTILFATPNSFADEIFNYMKDSLDDKGSFFQKADEISKIAEQKYQTAINSSIKELNLRLLSYQEQDEIIKNSKTFCIYGKTFNGEEIKKQLEDKGLKFLYWIDDASDFGAKEFLECSNKPDMIYLGACRPSYILDMLKKLDSWNGNKLALLERS